MNIVFKHALAIITLIIELTLFSGCSLIGYGLGKEQDMKESQRININNINQLKNGDYLEVEWTSGDITIAHVIPSNDNDSLYIQYTRDGYIIKTNISDITSDKSINYVYKLNNDTSARYLGTTIGILFDLAILYLLISLSLFNPSTS